MVEVKKDRVLELLGELSALYARKQSDYSGPGYDPFKNLRRSEAIGIPAWKGAVVRMMDKWSRIETLIIKEDSGEGPAVVDETLIDTLRDNAVYSLIVIALYEDEKSRQGA